MRSPQRSWRRRRRPAAFTLVEMMITIGVIVILTALTVSATVALSRRSAVTQTEQMLRLLDMAVGEWETRADRKITWGHDNQPYIGATYDMKYDTPHVFTTTEVLRRIRASDSVRSFLAQIPAEFLYTYNSGEETPPWLPVNPDPDDPDPNAGNARGSFLNTDWDGELAVLDPWDMPIRAVHPGRVADYDAFGDNEAAADPDGTVYLNEADFPNYGAEEYYGRAENRRIRFVSAGPDGKFGNLGLVHDDPIHEQAHDNVCSYPVEDQH
jgi:type II secretory pathway pseudopilin PulG